MSDDITGDLDLLGDWLDAKGYTEEAGLCTRAMDEINKLRAALRPFSRLAKYYDTESDEYYVWDDEFPVKIRWIRAAAAALKETGDE